MGRILVVLATLIDTDRKCNISFILPLHLQEKKKKTNYPCTEGNCSCVSLLFYPDRSKYFGGIYARIISASQMGYVKQILVACLTALHQRYVGTLILSV